MDSGRFSGARCILIASKKRTILMGFLVGANWANDGGNQMF
jgi:hypothetical protein